MRNGAKHRMESFNRSLLRFTDPPYLSAIKDLATLLRLVSQLGWGFVGDRLRSGEKEAGSGSYGGCYCPQFVIGAGITKDGSVLLIGQIQCLEEELHTAVVGSLMPWM